MSDTAYQKKLDDIYRTFQDRLDGQVTTLDSWNSLRVDYLGKSGILTHELKQLKDLPPDQRSAAGQSLNQLKDTILGHLEDFRTILETQLLEERLRTESVDMTLPADVQPQGSIHPLSQTIQEVRDICMHLGLEASWGPDIEHEDNNFTHLNMPHLHPARSMHDTFYLGRGIQQHLLRTHTTCVQVRALHQEHRTLPLRMFSIGRVYRSDWDATHTPMFHQVDGVWVDKEVHMGHLKGFLSSFLKIFFERDDLPIRFRPSFFPFTEPSAEVDIGYQMHQGQRKVGPGTQWLEILGCGMIHPQVLESANIDSKVYQGFAFGMGIERLAMLKYGITDMRRCYEGDIPWLSHFGFKPSQWRARS